MLNIEKWTTQGDIPRRKNLKGNLAHGQPPESKEMILNV
jgi:hypothetical protein